MDITRRIDRWNNNKVWIIKHYSDGHYYVNQEICGRKFYSRFTRMTKKQIQQIFKV